MAVFSTSSWPALTVPPRPDPGNPRSLPTVPPQLAEERAPRSGDVAPPVSGSASRLGAGRRDGGGRAASGGPRFGGSSVVLDVARRVRPSAPRAAVEELPGDVHVAHVAGRLLDHVEQGPAPCRAAGSRPPRAGRATAPGRAPHRPARTRRGRRRSPPRPPSPRAARTCAPATPCPWARRRRWPGTRGVRCSRGGRRSRPSELAVGAGRQRSCSASRPSSLKIALSRRCCSQPRAMAVSPSGAVSSGRGTRIGGPGMRWSPFLGSGVRFVFVAPSWSHRDVATTRVRPASIGAGRPEYREMALRAGGRPAQPHA